MRAAYGKCYDLPGLFSGIGGFRYSLERCGMKCIGYCEIDKYADRSYRAMFDVKEECYANDITQINPANLPRANIRTARFPCQDISVSGAMRGVVEGAKSSLFLKLLDCSKAKIPKINPNGLSLKMLRICSQLSEDGILRSFSIRWPKSATISSTDFSIQNSTAFRKT